MLLLLKNIAKRLQALHIDVTYLAQ